MTLASREFGNNYLRSVAGCLAWAAVMASSAAVSAYLSGWFGLQRYLWVCLLFGSGGALAWYPARQIAARFARHRTREAAFAVSFLSFALITFFATAFIYIGYYWLYFRPWHFADDARQSILFMAMATVASFYQFASIGFRFFLPLGLPAVFVVSYCYSRAEAG